jgi:alanine racemase
MAPSPSPVTDSDPATDDAPPAPSSSPESTRVLRPKRAAPADAVRPTRAEVNLAALRHNLRVLQRHAQHAQVWPVLKADGYGHGAPAVARTLERAGAKGFCVALLEEGIELREAGIRAPILVMGGYYGAAFPELLARELTPVVYHLGQLEGFAALGRRGGFAHPIDVHVKVDTGMARLGVTMDELARFAETLRGLPQIRVRGLMTHLASADVPSSAQTDEQLSRFDTATSVLAQAGVRPQVRHAANSAALLRGKGLFDMVRPGIGIFGISPPMGGAEPSCDRLDLKPVMRVRSEIVSLRNLEEGSPVGYGALFRAPRPSVIATVPMGYADGLSRHVTNRGSLLVRGKRAPLVGAVSMDMCMADVTDIPGVSIRDEVVFLGGQEGVLGRDRIDADELARQADTIPWEILTAISRRVPRFYREP